MNALADPGTSDHARATPIPVSEAMSDVELVARVMAVTPSPAGKVEANYMLGVVKTLPALASWAEREASRNRYAETILAALELGRRVLLDGPPQGPLIEHAAALARYLFPRYTVPGQEIFGVVFLDVRGRLLGEQEIFRGGLSRIIIAAGPIFAEALAHDASSIILFHTHPSGDPEPSGQDRQTNRRLREAGDVLGIPVVDHLILGSASRFVSLREESRAAWGV